MKPPLRALARLFLVLGVASICAWPARSQDGSVADGHLALPRWAVGRAEREIRKVMREQDIPGMSVAVTFQGRRWAQGYGLADLENKVPATPRTVYRLASVSKPITAVAVMQLVERGKLDLDAPIQRYVRDYPEQRWTVTSRHLLTHQGGVRCYRGNEIHSTRHYYSVTEALGMFRNDPLEFRPGTKYQYTSFGYNLLGAAVEGAGGKPYLTFVRESIFEPAGMRSTRDDDAHAIIPHRATGYRRGPRKVIMHSTIADTSNKVPGGGLCGTATDLVAFAEAVDHGKLLGAETLRRMWEPARLEDGTSTGYGLGWSVGMRDGIREVWHTGQQQQVSILLYMRPYRDEAVAIMCNLEGLDLMELARAVADAVCEPVTTSRSALQVVP